MTAIEHENFFADNWKYLLAALALHAVLAGALLVTFNATQRPTIASQLAIKAVVIDHTAERLKREQAEAERLAREQAEAEQRAKEAEAKLLEEESRQEAERQAQERERAEQERKQAEARRVQEQKAAARKQAEEKRAAEIKAKQAEKLKAERDAREQAQREAELKRQLAEEEGRMQAESSGLLSQYAALIEQRVVRNWNKPPSARPGIQCDVKVTQAPGGTVLSVQIDKCNGDAAVRQSIEAAVYRSSPLPPPPDTRLFQRVIVFVFKPSE